jgi:RNA polymerase sigma-70 factor (ECF subfamily)
MQAVTDESLMARLAGGEIEALGELYRRYGAMVVSALLRFARELPRDEAEDLCQEVFLTLRDTAAKYEEQSKLKAWLYGVAVQFARNWRRNRALRFRLLGQYSKTRLTNGLQVVASPEQTAGFRDVIRKTLDKLPPRHRELLVLSEVEGFSASEIAEITGMSPAAVWTRLHRIRKKLLRVFGDQSDRHLAWRVD